MYNFHDRQKRIINLIANSDSPITGKAISIHMKCSLKTIQNEISQINTVLPLIQSSNKGYKINKEHFATIQQEPLEKNLSEYEILKKIMFSDQPLQIDELADSLFLSTSTLEKKLNGFNDILQEFDLHIFRKKGMVSIDGQETNKRKFIRYLILKEIDFTYNDISNLNQYFSNIDTVKIKSIILNTIDHYNYTADTIYVNTLIINILIALYRMKFEHYVDSEHRYQIDPESAEYQIACEICEQYEQHWMIHPTHKDILYVSALLVGQIKPVDAQAKKNNSILLSEAFIQNIQTILEETFQYYMLDIDFSQYLYNFALHIDGMIKRAESDQPAHNTALHSLKKTSPFIHDVAVFIAQKLSSYYHIKIVDAEIGFISIHIGYLIENALINENKVNVLLFCDEYQHIAEKIQLKLLKSFSDIIHIQTIKTLQEQDASFYAADMVVTTKPVQLLGKKVVSISPFFNQQDQLKVSTAIQSCIASKSKQKLNMLCQQFFHSQLFFMKDDFQNKEQVIRFLGQKLIDFQITEDGFIESVLLREKMSSTVFFETFAVPHAIELDANRTMCCVLLSKKGILWDDQKIHIVLMIAVQQKDRKEFMELYEGIIQTMEYPRKVDTLLSAHSFYEFIDLLKDEM